MILYEDFLRLLRTSPDSEVKTALLDLRDRTIAPKSIHGLHLVGDRVRFYPAGKKIDKADPTKGMQEGRIGRTLKKVLKPYFPAFKPKDSDIEKLVNFTKACTEESDFITVQGADIPKYYNQVEYSDGDTGSLGNSCMRYGECVDNGYFNLYEYNEIVKMVVLFKDGRVIGRALLWDNTYLDRIYGTDSTIVKFKLYAQKNGWYYKDRQSYDAIKKWRTPDGQLVEKLVTFKMGTKFSRYPYLDTFMYMSDGKLSNNYQMSTSELRDTEGEAIKRGSHRTCCITGELIDCDDAVRIDATSEYTTKEHTMYDFNRNTILKKNKVTLVGGDIGSKKSGLVTLVGDQYVKVEDTYECQVSGNTYCKLIDVPVIMRDGRTAMLENAPQYLLVKPKSPDYGDTGFMKMRARILAILND